MPDENPETPDLDSLGDGYPLTREERREFEGIAARDRELTRARMEWAKKQQALAADHAVIARAMEERLKLPRFSIGKHFAVDLESMTLIRRDMDAQQQQPNAEAQVEQVRQLTARAAASAAEAVGRNGNNGG